MNIRVSLVLIVFLALVAGWALFRGGETPEPDNTLWFYNVDMDDISSIKVTHQDKTVSFKFDEESGWHFDDEAKTPVDRDRWGGITLLLSGPQTRRLLSSTVEDPKTYGLDEPPTIITVGLTSSQEFKFYLGDKTADGRSHYATLEGFPQLFLIDSSWGDVLSRLANEPPYPKPTPEAGMDTAS